MCVWVLISVRGVAQWWTASPGDETSGPRVEEFLQDFSKDVHRRGKREGRRGGGQCGRSSRPAKRQASGAQLFGKTTLGGLLRRHVCLNGGGVTPGAGWLHITAESDAAFIKWTQEAAGGSAAAGVCGVSERRVKVYSRASPREFFQAVVSQGDYRQGAPRC